MVNSDKIGGLVTKTAATLYFVAMTVFQSADSNDAPLFENTPKPIINGRCC